VAEAPYEVARIDEIQPFNEPETGCAVWRPVRARLGIGSFGTNAFVAAAAGDELIEEHSETAESGTKHEELYFVAAGAATFTIGGDTVDAGAGTFVYVPDPEARRSAVAGEPGTTVLVFGGEPGEAFTVSSWEQKYLS